MSRVFIIAEAGVNHGGDIKIAKKMIDVAYKSGSDAVKFQTFKSEILATRFVRKAKYQKRLTGAKQSQLDMLKRFELTRDAHEELIAYCGKKKIIFLSSPFDLESIELLSGFGLNIFKVPSGEITNLPYLRKIGGLQKKIIMSTGMSNLKEVAKAMSIIEESGTKRKNITLLHCTSEYPAPVEEANLLAMLTLKNHFGVKVGYSDHTLGYEVAIAAVALGAEVIEKHFTLDRGMKGPDHRASLTPEELKQMVESLRRIELALGSGLKKASLSEHANSRVIRKSIVAVEPIKKGEIFTEVNIAVKRAGRGISPMQWDLVLGRRSQRNFEADELIRI